MSKVLRERVADPGRMYAYASAENGSVRRVQRRAARAIKPELEEKGCTERCQMNFVRCREGAEPLAHEELPRISLGAVRGVVRGCGWRCVHVPVTACTPDEHCNGFLCWGTDLTAHICFVVSGVVDRRRLQV